MHTTLQKSPVVSGQFGQTRRRIPRWLWFAVSAILVIVIVAVVLLTRGNSNVVESAASVATVEVTQTGFSPQVIRIKKGERITWVNKDSKPHQVYSDPHPSGDLLPSLKSSEPLLNEESYTAVFEKTGTFTYHDYLDPVGFKGSIIVE